MRATVLALLWAFALPVLAGEKLSGSNVDVRTTLAYKVSDDALQRVVPEGWEASPTEAGPLTGSNLFVVLINSTVQVDAEGKVGRKPFQGVVLAIRAKKKGSPTAASMVFYGITAPESVPGAYGNYVPGVVSIARNETVAEDGMTTAEEAWTSQSEDGNAIEVQVRYERSSATLPKFEQQVYSAKTPEFFRLYRITQIAEVVRSTASGVNRVSRFALKANGPKVGPLFDWSARLVGIVSIPSYSRMVFLPD